MSAAERSYYQRCIAIFQCAQGRFRVCVDGLEPVHVGMHGQPCRCTPERRAEFTRGHADACSCHGARHADCPQAKPCLGRCGRSTTPHETQVPGYCPHCAADRRWVPISELEPPADEAFNDPEAAARYVRSILQQWREAGP